jgi:hypothetical protein
MTPRTLRFSILAALLLTASMALAAAPSPGTVQAPSMAVTQPQAALSTAAPLCPGASDFLSFLPQAQSDAVESCGPCSDAACVGLPPNSVCGSGFRCIVQGACSSAAIRRCHCLII